MTETNKRTYSMKIELNLIRSSKDILHPSINIFLNDDVMCQKLVKFILSSFNPFSK